MRMNSKELEIKNKTKQIQKILPKKWENKGKVMRILNKKLLEEVKTYKIIFTKISMN